MEAKKFKKELAELLKKHGLFPAHPGKLVIVGNVSPELQFGEVKLSPEIVIK